MCECFRWTTRLRGTGRKKIIESKMDVSNGRAARLRGTGRKQNQTEQDRRVSAGLLG